MRVAMSAVTTIIESGIIKERPIITVIKLWPAPVPPPSEIVESRKRKIMQSNRKKRLSYV